MKTMILKDVKTFCEMQKRCFSSDIEKMQTPPRLAIVQVGNNEASNRYVRNKIKDCNEVGIFAERYWYPEDITEIEMKCEIKYLSQFCDGLIVQLPLPPHIRYNVITFGLLPLQDVDGFLLGSPHKAATPKGIMDYLKYCEFDLTGKHVVIIGRSEIVGKPLAKLMTDANATVSLCHSYSKLEPLLEIADLVVCAVGQPHFLDCSKLNCPVIDVGINFDENGKLVGDCYNTEGKDVTPVPGGVGLLTRCALLDNVIKAAKGGQGLCQ